MQEGRKESQASSERSSGGTRDRLVSTARKLFNAGSFFSVSVQQLCAAAGVQRGTFYYHFVSKDDLVLAALDEEWQALRASVYEPAITSAQGPVERLELFADLLQDYHGRRANEAGVFGGCPLTNLSTEMATTNEDIRARVMSYFGEIADYYRRALEPDGFGGLELSEDASVVAERILAYVQGVLTIAKTRNDPAYLRVVKTQITRIAGIAAS